MIPAAPHPPTHDISRDARAEHLAVSSGRSAASRGWQTPQSDAHPGHLHVRLLWPLSSPLIHFPSVSNKTPCYKTMLVT